MRKPFLTYFLICAVPLLLLAALNYWNATRSVDNAVNTIVQNDLNSFTAAVDQLLEAQGKQVLQLGSPSTAASDQPLIVGVLDHRLFKSFVVYDAARKPHWSTGGSPPPPNESVWTTQGNLLLERFLDEGSSDMSLEFATPIHAANGLGNEGAVVGIVDLPRVLAAAARPLDGTASRNASAPRIRVTNRSAAVIYQSASTSQMSGDVTASAPMPRLNLNVAVSRSTGAFVRRARVWGAAGFAVALLLAALAALLLDRHVRARSRGIARVEEDLSAIAQGDIDRQILLQSSDAARPIADNINAMTAQLR